MHKELDIQPERDILTTRVLHHPRAVVFRAWTDPELLQRWWGPKGFTNTFHAHDLRPGGLWDFTMHGPDGKNYHNVSMYRAIEAPARLIFDHVKPMHRFEVLVLFEDLDGHTRLHWRMRHPTPEERAQVIAFVPAANEENLDRLEAVLAEHR